MGQLRWITIEPSHYNNIIYAYYAAGTVSALPRAGGSMFANLTMLSLAVLSTSTARDPSLYRPKVELWTNRGDAAVYTRGERVRLYFRLDQDAYVTIFRVDTDGRIRVLFPRDPWEDNFARGGRDLEVDGSALASEAFTIDDYPGVGYLFAVASADPFVYDQIESGQHWDYPYRYYGGSRTVFVRPYRPQPRFIFKDWGTDRPSREGFVSRERERPVNDNTRRGVTGRDIGGLGSVPPPNVRDRRGRPGDDHNNGGDDRGNNGNDHGNRGNNDHGNRGNNDHGNRGNDDRGNRGNDDRGNRGNDDRGNRGNDNRGNGGGRPDRQDAKPSDRPMVLPPRDQPRVEPRVVEPRSEPRRDEPRRGEPRNET